MTLTPRNWTVKGVKHVQAELVTVSNLDDIAAWCRGQVSEDRTFVLVPSIRAPFRAYVGSYLILNPQTNQFHEQDASEFEDTFAQITRGSESPSRGRSAAETTPGYIPGLSHAMHDVDAVEHESRIIPSANRNLLFGKPTLNKE